MHELPGLVDHQDTFFLLGFDTVPDVVEGNVHTNRSKFIFEVADIEYHKVTAQIHIALLAKDTTKRTLGVAA